MAISDTKGQGWRAQYW